jgi:lipoate-protein ligase A
MKCALRNTGQDEYEFCVIFARMRIWEDDLPRSGPEAMAVDEWLLESCEVPTLRVYRWSDEWGSLGYFSELASARSSFPDLQWVRRRTGGGVVDHRNDWTYTIIDPAGGPLAKARGDESYRLIHQALSAALGECGIACRLSTGEEANDASSCFQNPVRRDLVSADGKKIAGAGQRRTQRGLLHQGSLALKPNPDLSLVGQFATQLANEVQFVRLDPPKALIESKVAAMYGCDAWTHRR